MVDSRLSLAVQAGGKWATRWCVAVLASTAKPALRSSVNRILRRGLPEVEVAAQWGRRARLCCGLALGGLAVWPGCRWAIDVDRPMCVEDADCEDVGDAMVCGSTGICIVGHGSKAGSDEASKPSDDDPALQELRERYSCVFLNPAEARAEGEFSMNGKKVTVELGIVDFFSGQVPEDLVLRACAVRDFDCETPVVDDVRPDFEAGTVSVELPHGFNGFLEATASGYLPIRWSSNAPLLQDISFEGPAVVTEALLSGLARQGGEVFDGKKGVLIVDLLDCEGEAAEGVVLQRESDLDEHAFYFASSIADSSLPASTISTSIGALGQERTVGGFINVPPGTETVRATLLDTDVVFGLETVVIKPSTVTYLRLYAGAAK